MRAFWTPRRSRPDRRRRPPLLVAGPGPRAALRSSRSHVMARAPGRSRSLLRRVRPAARARSARRPRRRPPPRPLRRRRRRLSRRRTRLWQVLLGSTKGGKVNCANPLGNVNMCPAWPGRLEDLWPEVLGFVIGSCSLLILNG